MEARNSTSSVPPLPSSVTMVPLARGGATVASTTLEREPAQPTSEASMDAAARSSVSTGFFYAAMMPLNEG